MLDVEDATPTGATDDGSTVAAGDEGTRAESWMSGDVHAPIYGRRAARLETTNAQHEGPPSEVAQRAGAAWALVCV